MSHPTTGRQIACGGHSPGVYVVSPVGSSAACIVLNRSPEKALAATPFALRSAISTDRDDRSEATGWRLCQRWSSAPGRPALNDDGRLDVILRHVHNVTAMRRQRSPARFECAKVAEWLWATHPLRRSILHPQSTRRRRRLPAAPPEPNVGNGEAGPAVGPPALTTATGEPRPAWRTASCRSDGADEPSLTVPAYPTLSISTLAVQNAAVAC